MTHKEGCYWKTHTEPPTNGALEFCTCCAHAGACCGHSGKERCHSDRVFVIDQIRVILADVHKDYFPCEELGVIGKKVWISPKEFDAIILERFNAKI